MGCKVAFRRRRSARRMCFRGFPNTMDAALFPPAFAMLSGSAELNAEGVTGLLHGPLRIVFALLRVTSMT